MTDYPRYQTAAHCSFEESYRQHHGAPLVEAALPPKLTVPMIVFFLLVLFIVILGPAIIQVFRYN